MEEGLFTCGECDYPEYIDMDGMGFCSVCDAYVYDTDPSCSKFKGSPVKETKWFTLLNKAIVLARDVLQGKQDLSGQPLFDHCVRISESCKKVSMRIAAILHEVIEDGDLSYDLLLQEFGSEIADIVDALSRRKDESYMSYIRRCSCNDVARDIKLLDLQDNMNVYRLRHLSDADISRLRKYMKARDFLLATIQLK